MIRVFARIGVCCYIICSTSTSLVWLTLTHSENSIEEVQESHIIACQCKWNPSKKAFVNTFLNNEPCIRFLCLCTSRDRHPRWLSWMRVRLVIRRLRDRPCKVGNILSWRFDHEIFSTVLLSFPLIQEGQFSVPGERVCTILVNRSEDKASPVKLWLGKLTALDMTLLGWMGRKT